MQFNILNRFTGSIQCTVEIEADEITPMRIRLGLAVKVAYASGADLRGADLSGADLSGADLRGADLRDAVLSGAVLSDADLRDAVLSGAVLRDADLRDADLRDAVLSGAVLRDADLRDAVLRGADLSDADLRDAVLSGAVLRGADLRGADLRDAVLSGAVLSDAVLSGVPFVENIDAKILAAIEANKETGKNGLDMRDWHGSNCDETNWCETSHCRAGYAICVAGKEGFDLERRVGSAHAAGILLYLKSTPDAPLPDFFCSNEEAMADIRARAEKQTAKVAAP